MIRTAATYAAAMLLSLLSTGEIQAALSEEFTHGLQFALDSQRDSLQAKGASASVILPDGSSWTAVSGVAYGSEALSAATRFEIGSITKSFTAAVILQLVGEGSLQLDETIERWAPDIPSANEITLRQLLNHTSGLADPYDNPDLIPALIATAGERWEVESVLEYLPESVHDPGQGWEYSSANYMLLGMVIREETGHAVSAVMRSRLLEPLALQETCLASDEAIAGPFAHAFYDVNGDGTEEDLTLLLPATAFQSAAWTAGAMVSTARDVAVFMREFVGGALVADAQREEMLDWVERGDGNLQGLGVFSLEHNGVQLVGHRGNSAGYSGAAWHAPDVGITIAVLTNRHGVLPTPIVDALLEIAVEAVRSLE